MLEKGGKKTPTTLVSNIGFSGFEINNFYT